jgi:hypothetical protein
MLLQDYQTDLFSQPKSESSASSSKTVTGNTNTHRSILDRADSNAIKAASRGVGTSSASVVVYIARGAPRRWYQQELPFGIKNGPTRVGRVTYSLQKLNSTAVGGSIALTTNPGQVLPTTLADAVVFAVKVRAPHSGMALARVDVVGAAVVMAMHAVNETVVFAPTKGNGETAAVFQFTASFHSNSN